MSSVRITYIVDTDPNPHATRVKASANRGARRLALRLRNRLGSNENYIMKRDAGRRTIYVPVRGESFTVKREAERFARKYNGTVYVRV